MIRQIAKSEKCTQFVKGFDFCFDNCYAIQRLFHINDLFFTDFENCCKNASIFMVIKCRNQNNQLKNCLTDWYNNQQFREYVTELYLNERAEYRRTGVQKKFKRM